ncbi:MAG: hypothetical protein EAZ97_15205 [Bacteroidetes bacterium]|nr:MAG: hypothetical protein EAZ97_15205 [Bacteroidota bacterium]
MPVRMVKDDDEFEDDDDKTGDHDDDAFDVESFKSDMRENLDPELTDTELLTLVFTSPAIKFALDDEEISDEEFDTIVDFALGFSAGFEDYELEDLEEDEYEELFERYSDLFEKLIDSFEDLEHEMMTAATALLVHVPDASSHVTDMLSFVAKSEDGKIGEEDKTSIKAICKRLGLSYDDVLSSKKKVAKKS